MHEPIVIVGAGAAGVAAGRWLRAHGQRPVVLEARSRAGGRAATDIATFGKPVDLGAAWLHFADVSPWSSYAREHGFDVIVQSPDWQRRVGKTLLSEDQQRARQQAWDRYESIIDASAAAGRDVAMDTIIPNDEYRPVFDGVMRWLMGADTEQVSSLDYARYADNDNNWSVREGLGAVVERAAKELDIRFGTPVDKIDWGGAPPIKIITLQGTMQAAAVIVTVPTTVLATGKLQFIPALPTDMQEAFAGVPLGVANKVFLEFAPGTLPFEGTTHFVGTDKSPHTASYAVRPAGQELLLAYFGGSFARELEVRGELLEFAREELQGIFGSDFVGQIRRTLSTAWSTDVWSQGSYSAALPGCARMRERLDEVVGDRLFFAGEANSTEYFGTLYGAWLSGVQAAKRALQVAVGARP